MFTSDYSTIILDHTKGVDYYSFEYYNPTNQQYDQLIKHLQSLSFTRFNKYLYKTKYLHYSIQQDKLTLYYTLFRIRKNNILLGIDISSTGSLIAVKLYIINRMKRKISGWKVSVMKIKRIHSKFIWSTDNLNIIYRDTDNIYFCFSSAISKLINKKEKIHRLIDKIRTKYGRNI